MIGDNDRKNSRLEKGAMLLVFRRQQQELNHVAWLFVIEENRKIAEGRERKKFCAAARK